MNSAPAVYLSLRYILPPVFSVSDRHIGSPSPTPCVNSFSFSNLSNISSFLFMGIPHPRSEEATAELTSHSEN